MVAAAPAAGSVAGLAQGSVAAPAAGSAAGTAAVEQRQQNLLIDALVIAVSIVLLKFGADFVVDNSVIVASGLGVSERVIGITVVALGTCLPELVTGVVAALKGNTEIAVGNVMVSNVANVLLVIGAPALFSAVPYDAAYNVDFILQIVFTAALLACAFHRPRNRVGRIDGSRSRFSMWRISLPLCCDSAGMARLRRGRHSMSGQKSRPGAAAKQAPLISSRQRRRLERRSVLERITSSGTIAAAVMIVAVAAVVCANTELYEPLHEWFARPVVIGIGGWEFSLTFELFVNDFLMAIFFLLVGIELKYEMTVAELRRPRQAMLPMLAAVGGVVVPACIYAVINRGGAIYGWAIPMATDIAFALGVLSLLGSRVPPAIKVFFSTLAIADDLLAILAIALFYGHAPSAIWLLAAAAVTLALAALNRAGTSGSRRT